MAIELTITASELIGETIPANYVPKRYVPVAAEIWTTIRGGAGNSQTGSYAVGIDDQVIGAWEAGKWTLLSRPIITFDTSVLAGKVIVSAILKPYVWFGQTGLRWSNGPPWEYNIFSASPGDPIYIVQVDYQNVGTTPLSTAKTFATLAAGMPKRVDYNLNSAGIAAINTAGYTFFSIRESKYDATGDNPPNTTSESIVSDGDVIAFGKSTDLPQLVVTYGETYPSVDTIRVSGIIHRWEPGDRNYNIEVSLGGVTTDFTVPQIGKARPAVPSASLPPEAPPEVPIRYRCPICGLDFATEKDLSHHIALTHLTIPLIQ